jgi:hypothetical protein
MTCVSRHHAPREFRTSSTINTLDACIFTDDAFPRPVGGIKGRNFVSAGYPARHRQRRRRRRVCYLKDRKVFRFLAYTESLGSGFVVTPPEQEPRCLIPQAQALARCFKTDFMSLDGRAKIG